MSASPRSSRSLRSSRSSPRLEAPWKSLKKKTPHSSLSLILAHAESGTPLPSAASHLPPVNMAGDPLKNQTPSKEIIDLPQEGGERGGGEIAGGREVDPSAREGGQAVTDGSHGISAPANEEHTAPADGIETGREGCPLDVGVDGSSDAPGHPPKQASQVASEPTSASPPPQPSTANTLPSSPEIPNLPQKSPKRSWFSSISLQKPDKSSRRSSVANDQAQTSAPDATMSTAAPPETAPTYSSSNGVPQQTETLDSPDSQAVQDQGEGPSTKPDEEFAPTQETASVDPVRQELVPPVATPLPTKTPSEPAQTIAPKRSWFGTLSRGKSPETVPQVNAPATAPVQNVSDASPSQPRGDPPVLNIMPPTPPRPEPTQTAATEPQPPSSSQPSNAVTIQPKRSWFSSPARSPPQPSPVLPSAPPMPQTPMSIDEEVPKLPVAKPEPTVSPPAVSEDNSQRLSSLNPSTSRFSLSIPLLGRPKVPLDKALASAKAADIREVMQSEPSPADSERPSEEISLAEAPQGDVPQQVQQTDTPTPKLEDRPPSNSPWWNLVGWGSNPHLNAPKDTGTPQPAPEPDQPSSDTTVDAPPPPEEAASPPPVEVPAPEPPTHTKATSARSQDTQASTSQWYTPWTWYTSQPAAPVAPGKDEQTGKTAAEAVKEEALAREEQSETAAPADPQRSPPRNERPNPIENTITTNLPGWASFFSSRTLAAKRVTEGERDENGMEVMEVDVGEEEAREPMLVATSEDVSEAGKQVSTQVKPAASAPKASGSGGPAPKPDGPKSIVPARGMKRKSLSPAPSKASGRSSPTPTNARPLPPNLVLPTWDDTFGTPPRSTLPAEPSSKLQKTMRFVSGVLFDGAGKGKGRADEDRQLAHFGKALPRAWSVMGERAFDPDVLRGCKRVVVIGIHGWFPGAMMRSVLGEPTGTSGKFVTMMCQALDAFQEKHNVKLEKVTPIPLEGEGTIIKRVEKLYKNLTSNKEWMDDLHAADAILVATHSQGSIVSTHLLDRLIQDKHVRTSRVADMLGRASAVVASGGGSVLAPGPPPQRVCCLALCGIHLGPLKYLSSSSLLSPYIQYFESAAAKELFEFQSTESEVSKTYVKALRNVLDYGTKMVYVASLNDQVVPIYSGIFTAASHPLILRALYIDGDAYHSSDFLTNLLVLLVRILNAGLSDSGLAAHLSEATAGSLNGIGHSTAYEELETYSLAVNYLFLANQGLEEHPELVVEPFNANTEQNDYEIPWALRDLIADAHVWHLFTKAFSDLRDAFPHWQPKTTVLRDIKRKLQPIQRLNAVKHAHAHANSKAPAASSVPSSSKL